MDFVYLSIAAALWFAIWGLAVGCARLRESGSRP
jgi:hypothetical protein